MISSLIMCGSAKRKSVTAGALFFCLAFAQGTALLAAPPVLVRTIHNPIPEAHDNFARNLMSTPEGVIVAGSAGSSVNGVNKAGEVHLIDVANGGLIRTLTSPDPQLNLGFGAFAWAGNSIVAVATAAYAHPDPGGAIPVSGRVELFDKNTGAYLRTINNPTPGPEEYFGYGLGMLDDTVIAGARGDDTDGHDAGLVYLFNGHTGALLRTLHNPSPTGQDNFGYSVVGFAGNKIAVSAPGNDTGAVNSGVVHIFNADTGALLHSIYAPQPVTEGNFGFQVRSRGKDIIIGAPGQQKSYLYDGETGALKLRLNHPQPHIGGAMGSTVSAVGHHILVGNPLFTFGDQQSVGRAYLFNGNSGYLMQTFDNPTPEAQDRFGVGVVGTGSHIVISADQNRVNNLPNCGSLFVYAAPVTAAADWALYR